MGDACGAADRFCGGTGASCRASENLLCHLLIDPDGMDKQDAVSYFRKLQLKLQLFYKGSRGLPVQIENCVLDRHTNCLYGDTLPARDNNFDAIF